MTIKNTSRLLSGALVFTLIFLWTAILNSPANAKSLANKKIVGVWELNRSVSDVSFEKIQAKVSLLPTNFLFAPKQLIVATDEETNDITINEGFENFINTLTLPTDGTPVTKNLEPSKQFSAKALWKNKKMVIEFETSKGGKITETFEISGDRLNVFLQIEEAGSSKPLKIKRVYDRVAEQIPSEDDTVYVSLTEFPM